MGTAGLRGTLAAVDTTSNDRVERVAAQIARGIANGDYRPGERLPGVRVLAQELGTSVVTVRLAITVLHEALLVQQVARVGVVVLDPKRDAGVRAWGLLLDPPIEDVAWLRAYIGDLLSLVQMVMDRVARELVELRDLSSIQAAVDHLAKVVAHTPGDRYRTSEALLDTYRAVLLATGHPAYVSLVNELYGILERTPSLRRLFAPDPAIMVPPWRALLALLPDLNKHNIDGILRPLIRASLDHAVRAFDEWVELEHGAEAARSKPTPR